MITMEKEQFEEYLETYHEITLLVDSVIERSIERGEGVVYDAYNLIGRCLRWEITKKLTDSFMLEFQNEDWVEFNWFDVLEEFVYDKIINFIYQIKSN